MRMPTRLTSTTPPAAAGAERDSAQTTPYCSPGAASLGTMTVTVAITRPPAGTSAAPGRTDVHVDTSFGVCPATPRNEPFAMVAAAAYRTMCCVEDVVLETSIRRWM